MGLKKSRRLSLILRFVILILILLFLLFPIYWMVLTSLKTNMEAYRYPPSFFKKPVFNSYIKLITENNEFFVYYVNNFIVAGATAAICTMVAILTGYSLARFRFSWVAFISAILLSTQMFPIISRMISLYSLMRKVGLINTRSGLILAISAAQIPFCSLLMSSFYRNVPKEIEEAAYVDGAGRNTILWRLVTPLVKPGLVAVFIYAFLMAWDDYLHASTLIQTDSLRTLSIGIALRYLGELSYDWSFVNAISVIGALPMILLFLFFQKYMIKGLVAGAVKG